MIDKTIAIYSFLDDILKAIKHTEPDNRKASDAEIITTALLAAKYFGGNIESAISFVKSTGLMPGMLGKSRFNRRIHALFELLTDLFLYIGEAVKALNISSEYSIDSFPAPVCENIRIKRSRIIKGEEFRGYKASMRKYFYGFTIQVIATVDGTPVEFIIHPGSWHDIDGMKNMHVNLPEKSKLFGDSAYTDYSYEDDIFDAENIKMMIDRKSNSKRPHEPWENFLIETSRKRIETTFSQITAMFPKRIHAVTLSGFILKLVLFILIFTLNNEYL
jgi:hypothetical protein